MRAWLAIVLLLAPSVAVADTTPAEVLGDRCRMECRAAPGPQDACTARCTCVVQGFQLGLPVADLPRWISALDGAGPEADAARRRWSKARQACADLQSAGGY